MGRSLLVGITKINGRSIAIGTTHLESKEIGEKYRKISFMLCRPSAL